MECAGQHVEEEAAGIADGTGFDELRTGLAGTCVRQPKIADFDREIPGVRTGESQPGMEDLHPRQKAGMAGKGGQTIHDLPDQQQSQPGGRAWQRASQVSSRSPSRYSDT